MAQELEQMVRDELPDSGTVWPQRANGNSDSHRLKLSLLKNVRLVSQFLST
jgi:hypothetical protein